MARSRFRSVSYDLESCLSLARQVHLDGGTVGAPALAVALGYTGARNGAFLTRLANARLFGLVGGRSGRVVLTERGSAAIGGSPADRRRARQDAVRAVPLFAALIDARRGGPLGDLEELTELLVREFGEPPAKARTVAAKFVRSVGQADLLSPGPANVRSNLVFTNFTALQSRPSLFFLPKVRSPGAAGALPAAVVRDRRGGHAGGRDGTVDGTDAGPTQDAPGPEPGSHDPAQLWLDEPGSPAKGPGQGRRNRRLAFTLTAAACAVLVAVPVGLVLASSGGKTPPVALPPAPRHPIGGAAQIASGPATHQVLSALSATTDSGSFDFSYDLSATAATRPTTTPTTSCHLVYPAEVSPADTVPTPLRGVGGTGSTLMTMPPVEACSAQPTTEPVGTVVSGQGTIDTNPMAMVATALVGQNGGGLSVSVRVDGTDYWELSGGDKSLAPTGSDANASSGSPLHGFASLVEGTLGPRAGAVAMMGMASPTGYLDLASGAVTGAEQTGTATSGGITLTQYQVSIDPSQLASAPGITPEEATTIDDALQVLQQQGLTGISDTLSIDPTGYIRASTSVASFSDGATVSLAADFSNFGCAGTVLMPGQQGASSPPANCVSPDTGLPTSTTTLPSTATSSPSATTTTSSPSATTTTSSPSATTTTPPSTTTTNSPTTSTAPGGVTTTTTAIG